MSIEDDIFDVSEVLQGSPMEPPFANILRWAYDLEGENDRLKALANPLINIINLVKEEVKNGDK